MLLNDYDENHHLDSFPEDFECPLCMMIKTELFECSNCHQFSCYDCNTSFSAKKNDTNIKLLKFECTTCHKVGVFQQMNPILKQILNSLMF